MKNEQMSGVTFAMVWIVLMAMTGLTIVSAISNVSGKDILILLMMLAQAYLVSFYFMHLRFEKLPLMLSVILCVFITTGLLYFAILWDGSRIVKLISR